MRFGVVRKAVCGLVLGCVCMGIGSSLAGEYTAAAKKQTTSEEKQAVADKEAVKKEKKVKNSFVLSENTIPCYKKYRKKKNKAYNSETSQYFMLRSYLEKLQKAGGGVLTLKKGTYKIPAALHVSSNVTICFEDGVKLVKTTTTGTKKLKADQYLFQTVSASKASHAASVGKYKASKNVTFMGIGNATIDMGNTAGGVALYMGHADGIRVENIDFINRKGGNYLWIEGSRNVVVTRCDFYKGKTMSGRKNQMAVRLENINSEIGGFNGRWSRKDNTVNRNISVENNNFYEMEIGIGTTKYVSITESGDTKTYYQRGIRIKNNVFTDPGRHAVYAMGWDAPSICDNTMKQTKSGQKIGCYLRGDGIQNPMISGNTFNGCDYMMMFGTAENSGQGRNFDDLPTVLNSNSLKLLSSNKFSNVSHRYVLNDYDRVVYFRNKEDKEFTISPSSKPYLENYMDQGDYEDKQWYYTFLSYMEQLEYTGGGKITVEAGTYEITNNICVPSNVTINLKSGVVFRKAGTTKYDVCYAKSIFTLLPPSKDGTVGTVKGYEGSHNIKIIGEGTVTFDCDNVNKAMAIVMGHTKDITIRGITFTNAVGLHYIELNSSNNVTVENCKFKGFTVTNQKSHKECINVDSTDENTSGFNYVWSSHDKTTCKDIYIRNNVFTDIGTAVGSHTYSAEGKNQLYHENVQIYGNVFNGTYNSAVRALNWKDSLIRNNTFKNIQELDDGKNMIYPAVYLRGVVNPVITENIFDGCQYYPISIVRVTGAATNASMFAQYPNTICEISDANWETMKDNTLNNMEQSMCRIVIRSDIYGREVTEPFAP